MIILHLYACVSERIKFSFLFFHQFVSYTRCVCKCLCVGVTGDRIQPTMFTCHFCDTTCDPILHIHKSLTRNIWAFDREPLFQTMFLFCSYKISFQAWKGPVLFCMIWIFIIHINYVWRVTLKVRQVDNTGSFVYIIILIQISRQKMMNWNLIKIHTTDPGFGMHHWYEILFLQCRTWGKELLEIRISHCNAVIHKIPFSPLADSALKIIPATT